MLMKNLSDATVRLPAGCLANPREFPRDEDDKVEVKAGQEIECRDGYCHPSRYSNGARAPSVMEQYAPSMAPADEDFRREWRGTPAREYTGDNAKQQAAARRNMPSMSPRLAQMAAQIDASKAAEVPAAAPAQPAAAVEPPRRGRPPKAPEGPKE